MADENSLDVAMEKKNFGMSEKNIPLSMKEEHNLQTISKSERLVERMRWAAHIFLNPQENGRQKDTFGLKSQKPAPSVPELKGFEEGLYGLVAGIKYKEGKSKSSFQCKLNNELKDIRKEKRVFVAADKSSNFYKMTPETYNGLLEKAVHKDFKKAKEGEEEKITLEAKEAATKLEIGNRVFKTEMKSAKVTIKDHKEDFMNRPQTRLINPTKSNLGRVSKWKVEKLNQQLRSKTRLQQWLNTDATLAWFRQLEDKARLSFIVCDIVDYYPSITANLLDQALNWAAGVVEISEDDKALFHHTKNSLLWHKGSTWVKKGEKNFDVAQGSFDGAETTDLVGLFLLEKLRELEEVDKGLYRDDMLGVTKLHGKEAEKLKQKISTIFKAHNLTVKVEVNKRVVNYLNVTLNLMDGSHRDFMKPGQVIDYVHVESNHPPTVTKSIGQGVNHRLNVNSSSEAMFEAAKGPYQDALRRSGHTHILKYNPEEAGGTTRRRRRIKKDIIWFNPPWCSSVATDVGRKFLNLVDASFPHSNPLSKIFNRKKVKVSYSTMPSLGRIIQGHNAKVINSKVKVEPKRTWGDCSCPKKTRLAGECPLGGECLAECVVYRATVKVKLPKGAVEVEEAPEHTYLGLTEPEWKERLGNHKQDFKTTSRRNATRLSTFIWSLKEKGKVEDKDFAISWALVGRAKAYSSSINSCRLCLKEKSLMILKPEWATLNSRDEFFNHCLHKRKLLLSSIK